MSFPPRANSGGSGGSGNAGKMMNLLLPANITVGQDEIAKVPFDQIPENDGFTWGADNEIEIQEAGTVIINASVGAVIAAGTVNEITVGGLIFKNGAPLRQNSNTKAKPPYCIAGVTVIDKCVVGDKYAFYVNAIGGDDTSITIASSSNGVTGLEISYL